MTASQPASGREFVGLLAGWVERVVKLTGMDPVAAWTECTPLADWMTPARWRCFRAAVNDGDVVEVVFRARRAAASAGSSPGSSCFWYDVEDDGHQVRVHFSNQEGPGALGAGRRPQRRAELAAALDEAGLAAPQVQRIRGGSWLYHLPGYRALFPPAFLARAVAADPRTELMRVALWGQFVRGDGTLYRPHADRFIVAVRRAS